VGETIAARALAQPYVRVRVEQERVLRCQFANPGSRHVIAKAGCFPVAEMTSWRQTAGYKPAVRL
jgi:hypothetical protein